jgi:hypothetical protein
MSYPTYSQQAPYNQRMKPTRISFLRFAGLFASPRGLCATLGGARYVAVDSSINKERWHSQLLEGK